MKTLSEPGLSVRLEPGPQGVPRTVIRPDGSRFLPLTGRILEAPPKTLTGWPTLQVANWKKHTTDRLVLSSIRNGVTLPFSGKAPRPQILRQHHLSEEDVRCLDEKFMEFARLGVIRRAFRLYLVSPVFVVHQASKDREIFNAVHLNGFLHYQHFKMESLATVKALVRSGDWALKVDISKMYNTFRLHPSHTKFVQFYWPGTNELWEYVGCPFGLSLLPRLMTRIMKTVVRWIRRRGFRCCIYLDDILVLD